jgi:RNA polymerase sigma-70 factor (ECF subfamily)
VPVADSASSYLALSDRRPEAARVEGDLQPGVAGARGEPTDFRSLFHAHYASVWRLLRRFGVHPAQLDDAAQEVFWVAARRLCDIERGKEHAFLYGVAVRIASNTLRRQKTALPLSEPEDLSHVSDQEPSPEQRLEQRQARQLLDAVLDRMPLELRRVFVLYELERVAVRDIAELEDIPVGTASSRLRRAREEFSAIAKRVRATRVGSF